jgi:C-terminal processing protease CtpA/Prc
MEQFLLSKQFIIFVLMKNLRAILLLLFLTPLTVSAQSGTTTILSPQQACADVSFLENIFFTTHINLALVADTNQLRERFDTLRAGITDSIGPAELYRRLAPVFGTIRDIHCSLDLPLAYNEYYQNGGYYLPVHIVIIDKQLYVRSEYSGNCPGGAQILSINGIAADTIVQTLLSISSSEGDNIHSREKVMEYSFASVYPLFFPVDSVNELRLRVDSDTLYTSVDGANRQQTVYDTFFQDPVPADNQSFTFGYTSDKKIAYMRIATFMGGNPGEYSRFLKATFRYLNDHPPVGLIIDLRHNGGGFADHGKKLVRYLMPEPFTYIHNIVSKSSSLMQREIIRNNIFQPEIIKFLQKDIGYKPLRAFWSKHDGVIDTTLQKTVKPVSDQLNYKGFLILMIDGMSASTTGMVCNTLRKRPNTLITGLPAGCAVSGTFGQPTAFSLPNSGIAGYISILRFNQDNKTPDLTPIMPDVTLPESPADLVSGNDSQLKTLLGFLRGKMKNNE